MGRARLVDAMPEDAYHRRHELSSSKAKDYLRNPAPRAGQVQISQYEAGKIPSMGRLFDLAGALRVEPAELLR